MNRLLHAALAATTALVPISGAAMAQEAPAAAAASDTDAVTDGDIVVTATRRAERLQDVPVAVSAITGAQLQKGGFQSLQDIQYQFSGVQFGNSPNDNGFRLRSVGTAGGFSSSSEQNVGTVVDNVVIPFGNPVGSLGDLERVEVLKGPQGTQFGKNASSGVVNITTARPQLGKTFGSLFGSYATLSESNVNASVNLPLGQTAALGVFAFHRNYDDFINNITLKKGWGGSENYGMRAKLLWEPTDTLTVYVIGDWSRNTQNGPGQLWTLNRLPPLTNPLMAARFGGLAALGVTPGLSNTISVENTDAFQDDRNYGGSVELNLALGDYNLTSVTAYRRLDSKPTTFGIDALALPIFTVFDNRVDRNFVSEELRLTSPKGRTFEFVTGVYLSQLKTGLGGPDGSGSSAFLRPALPFSATPTISASNGITYSATTSKSAAIFIDGGVRLAQPLRMIGGLRVQHDNVDALSYSVVNPAYPPGVGPNGFVVPYTPRPLSTGNVKKTDWSGRAGLEYKPNADVLLFATAARGYLGPTVTFSGLTGSRVQVAPQTVRDITIGAKTQWFGRKLTLNANLFFDKYNDMQTSVFNGLEFLTENAGGFEANGFEADAALRLSPRLSLNGSVTYSDTKFTDYVTACPANIREAGAAAIAARCNAPGSTAAQPLFQAKDEPLSGAPKWSLTAGLDFNQPLTETLELTASANYYYRSRVQYDVGNPNHAQPGYSTVGGRIGIGAQDGRWKVAVFARNLFDKRFQSAVIGLPFSDVDGTVNWNTREGRRTVGASVEMKF